jgi:hypothetical protein
MKLALEAPTRHTLAIAACDERFPVNRVFLHGEVQRLGAIEVRVTG